MIGKSIFPDIVHEQILLQKGLEEGIKGIVAVKLKAFVDPLADCAEKEINIIVKVM